MGDNMEVLSVGEKIKRARIYKGYKLKDICGDVLSVSKLSCIENNKIIPEERILDYIAEKLDISPDYLKLNVEKQIEINLNEILKDKSKTDYEEKFKYNLELAEKYGYYDLAFKIMHLIFEHLLSMDELKKISDLIVRYSNLCNSINSTKNMLIYRMDLAKFLFKTGEFVQAANYFENVKETLLEEKSDNHVMLAESIYYEAKCYVALHSYVKAYNMVKDSLKIAESAGDDLIKAKMYYIMALLSLIINNGEFERYKAKADEAFGDRNDLKGQALLEYASAMIDIGKKIQAAHYIKEAINIYPEDNKEKHVKFLMECIECLINCDEIKDCEGLIEDVLNDSINLENIPLIEKAYYLKSRFFYKIGNMTYAEMYMNLSLDALEKFASKSEICKRYWEMGKFYYDIKSFHESLEYFSLAIKLQKKLEDGSLV